MKALSANFGCTLILLAFAVADDWPMYGRDRTHNGVGSKGSPPTDWAPGVQDEKTGAWTGSQNIRWTAKLGTQTFGDPVVADGQVWIGTNLISGVQDASVLAGFATHDGTPLFNYVSNRLPQGRMYDWPQSSMACSPVIEGDRMWFTTNRCEAVCLDIGPLKQRQSAPKEIWKVDMIAKFGVKPVGSRMMICHFCSPSTYKDLIYVITGNGIDETYTHIPAPDAPSIICFKKETGEPVWTDNSPGANILDGQWSSPLVIDAGGQPQVVAAEGDGWLRSYDARSGKLIWKFDINAKSAKWLLGGWSTRTIIMATPVYHDGRVYIASGRAGDGAGRGRLVCIDPSKTGDISTELAIDAQGQPLLPNRVQAVRAENGEKAVANPNSGLIWEYEQGNRNDKGKLEYAAQFHLTYGNVAIKDNLLIVGDCGGLVHCFDCRTGHLHWVYDSQAANWGSPLIVGDRVFIANEDGIVQIFRLSAEPQKPLAEIDMGSAVNVSPIFANGDLYLATNSTLFCVRGPDSTAVKPAARDEPRGEHEPAPRSAFSPTPQDVVEAMLKLANAHKTDVVCDLGSGDGRVVITAAKKFGCRAIGYEIDKQLVQSSRAKIEANGVKRLATIEQKDLLTADLSGVDIIAVYLVSGQLEKLVPRLDHLKPGTRIVAHHFPLPGASPNQSTIITSEEDHEKHQLFLYITPLRNAP